VNRSGSAVAVGFPRENAQIAAPVAIAASVHAAAVVQEELRYVFERIALSSLRRRGAHRATPDVVDILMASVVKLSHDRTGALIVRYTLGADQDAVLELIDLAGRIIASRSVSPGASEVRLGPPTRLAPGLYFLRLRQNGYEARARVAITR